MSAGFLDSSRGAPYCAGCGHPHVLQALDAALRETGVPPHRIALVTDIGCVGLADALFPTLHTVHTLHGRSVAIAAGLRMAPPPAGEPPLKPVVLIGDGGAGIGMLHLIHAAQLNVDVTVLVHNNLIYGMTGGQHSMLTPDGLRTTTTPEGCDVPPLDLGAVLTGAGAGFFARANAPSPELTGTIAQAILHPGFACVEALELCPTHTTRTGGLTGKDLKALPERLHLELGVLRADTSRPAFEAPVADDRAPAGGFAPQPAWNRLDRTARVVVAGRAGGRVQSAANLAATAAAAAGLRVTVRTDNPVTQGKGFSLAELTFSPDEIAYTGLVEPDLVVVVAEEGRRELAARGLLEPPGVARRYVFESKLAPPDGLPVEARDFEGAYGPLRAALGALIEEIDGAGWWTRDAWDEAMKRLPDARRAEVGQALKIWDERKAITTNEE